MQVTTRTIRAEGMGCTVDVINSTTYEEANRAPWQLGAPALPLYERAYLQTVLVHLRQLTTITAWAAVTRVHSWGR